MPGIDCGKKYCRERQLAPSKCAKGSFRTVRSGKALITVCCPKGRFHAGRCSVGTRAQSIARKMSHPKCNRCRR